MAKTLQPCGTNAAYQRHKMAGETPCEPCLRAHAAYAHAYRRAKGLLSSRPAPVCGTRAGYDKHRRDNTTPCQACIEANRAYFRAKAKQYRDEKQAQKETANVG